MKKMSLVLVAAAIFLIAIIVWKSSGASSTDNGKLKVVTSFYPLYFLTSEITGDKANVTNVTPAGTEPHDYDPTPQAIVTIENSNLLILNGGKLEAWGDKIASTTKTPILIAGKSLTTQDVTVEGKKITDPHVWLSPKLAKKEAESILSSLISIDRQDQTIFQQNAQTLFSKLDELDKHYRDGLKTCTNKSFVTSHLAFGYLARDYGLDQVAISGISPDEEPSTRQMAEVDDFVRTNNIKFIFFERLISPKLSETIASETGAKTLTLDPIEGLTPDEAKSGEDYFSIMEENLVNLRTALECR